MKKTLLLILAVGLLAGAAVACGGSGITEAGAADVPDAPNTPDGNADDNEAAVDEDCDSNLDDIEITLPGEGDDYFIDPTIPNYFSITGDVVSVEEADGLIRITIEDTDGNPAVLVLSSETVFPFADSFDTGETVTGWYRTDMPMIMIWPAEYSIAVLVAGAPEGVNIKVDRFSAWEDNTEEGYLISPDRMFAFRTDENTEIILADGQDFTDGDFEGRRIVVIYGISTRSIPEMATADKLIVLFESIMAVG